ncbi:ShlB/FhaC/HecB family hemolysin secretion/activation protein, partial [Salmonella enterica subsp. enterica serovar Newport]
YAGIARNNDYSLTLTWAHRTGDKDVTSGLTERDQFWVSAVKAF